MRANWGRIISVVIEASDIKSGTLFIGLILWLIGSREGIWVLKGCAIASCFIVKLIVQWWVLSFLRICVSSLPLPLLSLHSFTLTTHTQLLIRCVVGCLLISISLFPQTVLLVVIHVSYFWVASFSISQTVFWPRIAPPLHIFKLFRMLLFQ